jgi:TonB family protein
MRLEKRFYENLVKVVKHNCCPDALQRIVLESFLIAGWRMIRALSRFVRLLPILPLFAAFAFSTLAKSSAVTAQNKTDAELIKAVVGTYEAVPTEGGFSKQFVTFNADGTCKSIGTFTARGVPKRSEGQSTWHVSHGYLTVKSIKSRHDVLPLRFNAHAKIESIENGIVKVRDDKGEKGELRRISQLPTLPPLLKPVTMTQDQLGKFATHKPRPEYPMQARARRLSGGGFFILLVTSQTGIVKDVQIEQSTGSPILDSAAIGAFKQWRFKPGALSLAKILQLDLPERSVIQPKDYPIRVPVNFVMSRKS